MLYRKRNFATAFIDVKENIVRDKDLYWKAQALETLCCWDWVNMRDEVMGHVFRDADLEDHLKKQDKTVARGGGDFADPRHGGSSRTEKYEGAAGRRAWQRRWRPTARPLAGLDVADQPVVAASALEWAHLTLIYQTPLTYQSLQQKNIVVLPGVAEKLDEVAGLGVAARSDVAASGLERNLLTSSSKQQTLRMQMCKELKLNEFVRR